jgi:uncharacterized protein involved in outer membrane biogenesis
MKKIMLFVVIVIVAVIALVFAFRNVIAKQVAERLVATRTDYGLRIGSLNVSPFKGALSSKNIEILNPPGFSDKQMLVVPNAQIDVDTGSLFRDQKHFKNVVIDLKEVMLVKNKDGKFNFQPITEKKQPPAAKGKEKKVNFRIDRFKLTVGDVVYRDYTIPVGQKPFEARFPVNIDEELTNVQSIEDIVKPVAAKVLGKMGIKNDSDITELPQLVQKAYKAVSTDVRQKAQ